MLTTPPDPPATKLPDTIPMGASVMLVLVHVPPAGVAVSVAGLPTHTEEGPPMVEGVALTVTTRVVAQPLRFDRKVITDVPAAIPVTIPEVPTMALAPSLLQTPPPVVLLVSVVVAPSHTEATPPMALGGLLTVMVTVARQPAAKL